jgi:SAM-dependent methyltransferase
MTDRKNHWERVYRDKSPLEVSWFQENPALSLRLIKKTRIALDAPIIDVGGGASLLVDRLCEAGYSDIGVLDVSASALAHAKNRLADKTCAVNWYEADVTGFKPPKRFALWHDRAVFHFLTSGADRDSYVSVLKKALKPGGHLIMMAFAIDGPVKCSGLDIVQYDADKMKSTLGPGFELVETGHEMHITPTGNQQKFAYFRFTKSPEEI